MFKTQQGYVFYPVTVPIINAHDENETVEKVALGETKDCAVVPNLISFSNSVDFTRPY